MLIEFPGLFQTAEKGDKMANKEIITKSGGYRDSSIELLRIATMLVIVAHHYVVNSGITFEITPENALQFNSLFCLIFGWGGKTGINCFVLITGYFMCKSDISLKKFLKLVLEIEFYNIVIYLIFLLSGYAPFSVKELIKAVIPVYSLGSGFTSSYLVFFLFIPFLNLLINSINEKQHIKLLCLCILMDTGLQTFLKAPNAFTYVGWFMVLYIISSYIRLYSKAVFDSRKIWSMAFVGSLFISWVSVIAGAWVYSKCGKAIYYYFVADSNKILALATAVCAFMFFKNLKLKYSPFINKIAASAFGVLMIHANSDAMRQWLWKDTLNNVNAYHSNYLLPHAFGSVIGVYILCTLIDMIRIKLLEKPFFKWYDKKLKEVNQNE